MHKRLHRSKRPFAFNALRYYGRFDRHKIQFPPKARSREQLFSTGCCPRPIFFAFGLEKHEFRRFGYHNLEGLIHDVCGGGEIMAAWTIVPIIKLLMLRSRPCSRQTQNIANSCQDRDQAGSCPDRIALKPGLINIRASLLHKKLANKSIS
jgi:hypothetical protein